LKKSIKEAALKLMSQKGLKFTIADLASSLTTSKRTIYEQFASKEQLISTLVDEAIDEIKQREQEIFLNKTLSCQEKLTGVLSIIPSGLQVGDRRLLEQMKRLAPDEWTKIQQLLMDEWQTVQEIIVQGIEQNEFRNVPVPLVIQQLKGASMAIFDPDFQTESETSLDTSVALMTDVFLHGLVK